EDQAPCWRALIASKSIVLGMSSPGSSGCRARGWASAAPTCWCRSTRRGEELERDAVGVTEAEPRAVARVLDLTVPHAQLVQAPRPFLELAPLGAPERDVIEADAKLAELLV